jgi:hypothetical protein
MDVIKKKKYSGQQWVCWEYALLGFPKALTTFLSLGLNYCMSMLASTVYNIPLFLPLNWKQD